MHRSQICVARKRDDVRREYDLPVKNCMSCKQKFAGFGILCPTCAEEYIREGMRIDDQYGDD